VGDRSGFPGLSSLALTLTRATFFKSFEKFFPGAFSIGGGVVRLSIMNAVRTLWMFHKEQIY